MMVLRTLARKLPSLVLPPLLVFTSVAVPQLDRDLFGRVNAVESGHHPSTCPVGHDHTICTQVGANRLAPAPPSVPRLPAHQRALPPHDSFQQRVTRLPGSAPRARAPPTA